VGRGPKKTARRRRRKKKEADHQSKLVANRKQAEELQKLMGPAWEG